MHQYNSQALFMPERKVGASFAFLMSQIKVAAELLLDGNFPKAKKHLENAMHINSSLSNLLYMYSLYEQHALKISDPELLQSRIKAYTTNPCYFQVHNKNRQQILKQIIRHIKNTLPSGRIEETSSSQWVDMVSSCNKAKDLNTCLFIVDVFDKVKKNNHQDYTTYVYSNFGINLYQIGEYARSLAMYQFAIDKYDGEFRYFNNSAILAYIMQDYQKSEDLVHKSLSMKPNYAKSLFILSFSLAKTNRISESMQKILKAWQMSPNSLLYIFKIITNYLLYRDPKTSPESNQWAKQFLSKALKNISEQKDDDQYFFCPENKPILKRAANFINDYIHHNHNQIEKSSIGLLWNRYLQCLDDYLIRGHADKFRLMGDMDGIQGQVRAGQGRLGQVSPGQGRLGQARG